MNDLNAVLAHCRAGFENEAAEELRLAAKSAGLDLSPDLAGGGQGMGYVVLPAKRAVALPQMQRWQTRSLTFCRQVLFTTAQPVPLDSRDRVTGPVAMLNALRIFAGGLGEVWVDYPDTNEGKMLTTLARAIEPRMSAALEIAAPAADLVRGHVFLESKSQARIGLSVPGMCSPWRLGIPRLRMPSDAPSRSTLKLAEALLVLLDGREDEFLKPEMRAVDLGAAPGGWTWQLIHRGLHVTAVDNGELKGELRDNALVKHLRQDGFHFRPKRPVEWLVCDMVEKPARIAALVADWVATDTAQHAIFNLKLPMKKRLEEVNRCRTLIEERFSEAGVNHVLRFKQLYHDREEVTGFLTRHFRRFSEQPKRHYSR